MLAISEVVPRFGKVDGCWPSRETTLVVRASRREFGPAQGFQTLVEKSSLSSRVESGTLYTPVSGENVADRCEVDH